MKTGLISAQFLNRAEELYIARYQQYLSLTGVVVQFLFNSLYSFLIFHFWVKTRASYVTRTEVQG